MRVRVLRANLYAYALPGSTARDSYSTARHCSTARQNSTELDRPRQTSTDLDRPRRPRHMQSGSTGSTATRQLLDRLDRQGLDSPSTVRLPTGVKPVFLDRYRYFMFRGTWSHPTANSHTDSHKAIKDDSENREKRRKRTLFATNERREEHV